MTGPVLVTCCAADKDRAAGRVPAVARYVSSRIAAVAELARRRGAPFRILSGAYGLLAPDEPIPWYDHLLVEPEVDDLARRVAGQLAEMAPERVVFFTRAPETDPHALPYRACCEAACVRAGVPCEVVEVPAGPLSAAALEDR